MNSLSSPATDGRLLTVTLDCLHPHPANANTMSPEQHTKLVANIEATDGYQPLVVRPLPRQPGHYQILNGEQRLRALRELGRTDAVCFLWPCNDAKALLLVASLNRLEGEDVPAKRAELLVALTTAFPVADLARLLPEDAAAITDTLALLELDTDALLADLAAAAAKRESTAPRLISFALLPEDEAVVERAIAAASEALTGSGRRGRALALICRRYLEGSDA